MRCFGLYIARGGQGEADSTGTISGVVGIAGGCAPGRPKITRVPWMGFYNAALSNAVTLYSTVTIVEQRREVPPSPVPLGLDDR